MILISHDSYIRVGSACTDVSACTETHTPNDGLVRLPLSITSQNVVNADSTAPAGPTVADKAVPGWGSVDSLGMEGSNTRGATGWRFVGV